MKAAPLGKLAKRRETNTSPSYGAMIQPRRKEKRKLCRQQNTLCINKGKGNTLARSVLHDSRLRFFLTTKTKSWDSPSRYNCRDKSMLYNSRRHFFSDHRNPRLPFRVQLPRQEYALQITIAFFFLTTKTRDSPSRYNCQDKSMLHNLRWHFFSDHQNPRLTFKVQLPRQEYLHNWRRHFFSDHQNPRLTFKVTRVSSAVFTFPDLIPSRMRSTTLSAVLGPKSADYKQCVMMMIE